MSEIDGIPVLKRGKSTGKAQVFVLDERRIYIPVSYLCINCLTKYLAYLPDVHDLSAYLTCDCGSKNILLVKGLEIDLLEELHFEISPSVGKRKK